MRTKLAAAAGLAMSLAAFDANAACSPNDLVGKWNVTVQMGGFLWSTPNGVMIDSRGHLYGDLRPYDGEVYTWIMESTTAVKVDWSCNVTGQFTISYPIAERRVYEFRSVMNRTRDYVGDIALTPGYDQAPGGSAIMIRMIRR